MLSQLEIQLEMHCNQLQMLSHNQLQLVYAAYPTADSSLSSNSKFQWSHCNLVYISKFNCNCITNCSNLKANYVCPSKWSSNWRCIHNFIPQLEVWYWMYEIPMLSFTSNCKLGVPKLLVWMFGMNSNPTCLVLNVFPSNCILVHLVQDECCIVNVNSSPSAKDILSVSTPTPSANAYL